MPPIDIPALTTALRAALPDAEPFAAIPMFVAQVQYLDQAEGVALVDRVVTNAHPSTWQFTDELLDAWPSAVADRALDAVRALPPGENRVEGLCRVPRRLTHREQVEALQALIDGSFRERTWAPHSKPISRRGLIVDFVRTLPADDKEAWVHAEAARVESPPHSVELYEFRDRRDVGSLTEAAMRDLWSRIDHDDERGVPQPYLGLASCLPPDLRQVALGRIRACPRQSVRLYHLAEFDEELTDEERAEVVLVPWNEHTRDDPRTIAQFHLRNVVAQHLPKVEPSVRRHWLGVVLGFEENYFRQLGLSALLPSLKGTDHDEAVTALLAAVDEEGSFDGDARWDLVADAELQRFIVGLANDPYAWNRDELVDHVWKHRSASTTDALFMLLLDGLHSRPGDTRLEIATALTPWLANRTHGAASWAIAGLPVPVASEAPDSVYNIARVIREQG